MIFFEFANAQVSSESATGLFARSSLHMRKDVQASAASAEAGKGEKHRKGASWLTRPSHKTSLFRPAILFMLFLSADSFSVYTPRGVLPKLIEEKRREIDDLKRRPEARDDGAWEMRLRYIADKSSFRLAKVLGWRPEVPALLVDLKRTSPTGKFGETEPVNPDLELIEALGRAMQLGVKGAFVNTDVNSYGALQSDFKSLNGVVREWEREETFPLVAKDLIIDPLQLARAAHEGAKTVVIIAAACLPDLPEMLETCEILGIEALVEVHNIDDIVVAEECCQSLFLVNQRNRETGELVVDHAARVAPYLPPDAVTLACGGISSIDQIRKLRRAGYDGFVIGRAFCGGDPDDFKALVKAIADEPWPRQRITEALSYVDFENVKWENDEDEEEEEASTETASLRGGRKNSAEEK